MSEKGDKSHYKERLSVIAIVFCMYLFTFSPLLLEISTAVPIAASLAAVLIEGFLSANSDSILNWLVLKKWFMRLYGKKVDPQLSNEIEQYKKKFNMSNQDIYNSASKEMKAKMDEATSHGIMSAGIAVLFLSFLVAYIPLSLLLPIPPLPFAQMQRLIGFMLFLLSAPLAYSFGRLALIQRHKFLSCMKSVIKEGKTKKLQSAKNWAKNPKSFPKHPKSQKEKNAKKNQN